MREGLLTTILFVGGLLVACGQEEELPPPPSSAPTPSVEALASIETPPVPEDSATEGALPTIPAESIADPEVVLLDRAVCQSGVCLVVNSVIFHPFKPESEGLDGVSFDVTIENSTAGDIRYDVSEFLAADVDSFVYQPHTGAGSPPLSAATVPPGLKARGQILFEMSEGAQPRELRWTNPAAAIIVPVSGG